MKFIPNAVSLKAGRTLLQTQKASPTLLFAGGVVGIVASTVMACRATLKFEDVLRDHEKDLVDAESLVGITTTKHGEYTEEDLQKDKAYVFIRTAVRVGKLYAPSIALGALSIAALTGSHKMLNNRLAGVTAAYAAIEKGFAQYRERVVSEYGADKDRELRYGSEVREIVTETKNGPKVSAITTVNKKTGASIYAKFFDEYNKNWKTDPEYNKIFLHGQQAYANDLLHARGHVFLNDVYDELGIDRTSAGAVVGWVVNKDDGGDNFIDFGLFDGENMATRQFVNGREGAILLDFNVDGVIYDKI
jgi:hypothetical protein